MHTISTPDAPRPKGHYSQAIVHGGIVYVAGQLAIDPQNPDADPGDAGAQARLIFRNIAAILDAAGSSLSRLLQVTIYVSDIGSWPSVNEAFAEALGDHRPTRAIVPVSNLALAWDVEVVAIAAVDDDRAG